MGRSYSMNSHRTYNVQVEHTLELFPPADSAILVEAQVQTYDDENWGADADGNRGKFKSEITEIEIHTLILYFPGRASVRLFSTAEEIEHFLDKPELDVLVDLVCEKVFKGEATEV
jgi:hypothetical protein